MRRPPISTTSTSSWVQLTTLARGLAPMSIQSSLRQGNQGSSWVKGRETWPIMLSSGTRRVRPRSGLCSLANTLSASTFQGISW